MTKKDGGEKLGFSTTDEKNLISSELWLKTGLLVWWAP